MRLVPVLLAGTVLAAAAPAGAQVTINPGALDALPKAEPAHRRPPRRVAHPAPAQHRAPGPPAAQAPAKPAPPVATAKPAIPATPPAILAIPPPVVVPMMHPPPPPPVPVSADAPGAASPIGGGLRITFGGDRFDFNPATEAALRAFARGLAKADTPVTIYAYAAGSPDDPSTPRRLSLERALATRAVLMDEGIPSPRIYPRALGPAGGTVEPDRVDVVTGAQAPPSPESPAG